MYLKSLGSVSSRADFCASRSLHLLDSPLPDSFYPWEFRTSFALSVWQDTEKVQEGSGRGRESKKGRTQWELQKFEEKNKKKKFGWLCAGFLEKCWVLDPESPAFQLLSAWWCGSPASQNEPTNDSHSKLCGFNGWWRELEGRIANIFTWFG